MGEPVELISGIQKVQIAEKYEELKLIFEFKRYKELKSKFESEKYEELFESEKYEELKLEYEIARSLNLSITNIRIALRKYKMQGKINTILRVSGDYKDYEIIKKFVEKIFENFYYIKIRVKIVENNKVDMSKFCKL